MNISVKSFSKIILLIALSSFSIQLATAGVGTTVTRGDSTTIYWSVTGAASCQAQTPNYPITSDGIFSAWQNSTRPGTGNTTFTGITGSSPFPHTYDFTCQDLASGAIDATTLTVNDCPAGTTWNGTSACTCDNYPAGGNYPTCNVCPGGYTWTNDGSNGGTGSCLASSCGNGAIDPPTCTAPPTVTLTSDALNISYNNNANLTWTPANTPSSCTSTGGTFAGSPNPANGGHTQSTGNLITTTTYTIYCTNAGGNSATDSVTVTVCPLATPTWDGSSCVATPGPATVVLTATNPTVTYNTATMLNWNTSVAPSAPTSCTASVDWSGSKNIAGASETTGNLTSPVNSYTIVCSNAQGTATSSTVVNVCQAPTPNWNSSACVAVPSGTLVLSSSTCYISVGSSRCSIASVNWTVNNSVNSTSSVSSTASSSLSTSNSATLNNVFNLNGENVNTYVLKHNGVTLDTKTVTSYCVAGSGWNGSVCALDPATGSISANPITCTIAMNQSTCGTNIQWTTINSTSTTVMQDIAVFSTLSSSSTLAINAQVTFGQTTFYLNDDYIGNLDSVDVNAACATNSAWVATATPARCIRSIPTGTCTISSLDGTGPNTSTCNISSTGPNRTTCTSNITWAPDVNVLTPNIKISPYGPGDIQMSGNGGQISTPALTFGDTASYMCFDDTTSASVAYTATSACEAGSYWEPTASPAQCVPIPPTLSASSTGNTSINVGWDCNSLTAQSVTLAHHSLTGTSTLIQNVVVRAAANDPIGGLLPSTLYDYTLTCYDGPDATGGITGVATAQAMTTGDIITITNCANGTIPPLCDSCPVGEVFDGVRCVSGAVPPICGFTVGSKTCGNSIQESGEQCDGAAGISSTTVQSCSASCNILCSNGSLNSPSCDVLPVYCDNGAIQGSAPGCLICPTGDVYSTSSASCITPFCGNGAVEGTEQCDDPTGVSGTCTLGCCNTIAATSTVCSYSLSCTPPPIGIYSVRKAPAGAFEKGPIAYPGAPVSWTPSSSGNYDFSCAHTNTGLTNIQTITVGNNCSFVVSQPVKLTASPRTVKRGGTASITWSIQSPVSTCSIIALPVITAPTATCDTSCVADRAREATKLTVQFSSGKTDANDPNGANRTVSTALTTTGAASKGKKSVKVNYTTIFQAACGLNPFLDPSAVKARVQVAEDNEG